MAEGSKDQRYAARTRLVVLQGLSGRKRPRCGCCKLDWLAVLTIDHVHGDGAQERRERGHTSTWRYVWRSYREHGTWPTDRYQVLCFNCNAAKHQHGFCQHQGATMNQSTLNAAKSYAKVFAAVLLGAFLADGADVFAVSWGDVRTWVATALAAVLPLVITALDASDDRFGRRAQQ